MIEKVAAVIATRLPRAKRRARREEESEVEGSGAYM